MTRYELKKLREHYRFMTNKPTRGLTIEQLQLGIEEVRAKIEKRIWKK